MLDYRYNTFITLVETKSYTKTAKLINFTQPAVTKHIQYIEKDLGVSLVLYQDNKLTITSEGQYLYQEIKKLQSDIKKIKGHLINDTSLKIGSSKTIGEYLLSDIISNYTEKFETSDVSILVDNTRTLLDLLSKRKIDLALISGPVPTTEFQSDIFYEDTILLICSNNHPFANQTIAFKKLLTETFLVRESGAGIMESINDKLNDIEVDISSIPSKRVVGNINIIKKMVKKEEGISFIYQSSIQTELNNHSVSTITINKFDPVQPFYAVKNQQQDLNEAARFFLTLLS